MSRSFTDEEFITAWRMGGGSPQRVSQVLGVAIRGVYARRASLAKKGMVLQTIPDTPTNPNGSNGFGDSGWQVTPYAYPERVDRTVISGSVVVFGDAHWWGPPSLAHKAMCLLIREIKPRIVIGNGDLLDGASISRHDPMGWQKLPTVVEELDTVKIRMREIEQADPGAEHLKTVGNHDSRMDRRLATETPEFAGLCGFRLQDHIKWPMSYVIVINKDADVPVIVCHNYKGGVHAPFNNAVNAGSTMVTGHLHAQQKSAHTDFFRTKYGVDHGMLADPDGPQFSYAMGRPRSWRSGCCVLTFDEKGRHLPPELLEIQVFQSFRRAVFRGKVMLEEAKA